MSLFRPNEKTALFIDGANFSWTCRGLELFVDFCKFRDYFADQTNLIRSYYYIATLNENLKQKGFLEFLQCNGFSAVTKPARSWINAEGQVHTKGNMDMEIAIDVMQLAPYLDHVVIVSGDGDFRSLVEVVQRQGKVVTAVSSQPSIAGDLRWQVDSYIDILDIKDKITRDPMPPRDPVPPRAPSPAGDPPPAGDASPARDTVS